ncbi:MAG TPA: glycosyltransferase [Candidatus Binatia bacterium]|jgi:glycosyltransferase involved in cell wall biosynthesis|nr:glycosyltransferase [Candidatus Binatia bacterium]
MQYPLVSAVVLCYTQAKFVIECLEGVRAQQYPNLELIVNDDASKDDSANIIEAWLQKSNIPHLFLRSSKNQGLCRSLNRAFSHCHGKYICGIAADDVWLPHKLLTQVKLMEQLPEKVGVLYSDALQMDETGNLLPKRFMEANKSFSVMPQGNIEHTLWEDNFIPAMTTLVRRECYNRVGLFDEELFYEDWDMWLRIAHHFEFAYSGGVSAKYRLVSTSMARAQFGRIFDSTCQICVKHLKGGQLGKPCRLTAADRLYNYAIASYEHMTARHKRNLLQALRFKPSPGMALRCVLALAGVNSQKFALLRGASPRQKGHRCAANSSLRANGLEPAELSKTD